MCVCVVKLKGGGGKKSWQAGAQASSKKMHRSCSDIRSALLPEKQEWLSKCCDNLFPAASRSFDLVVLCKHWLRLFRYLPLWHSLTWQLNFPSNQFSFIVWIFCTAESKENRHQSLCLSAGYWQSEHECSNTWGDSCYSMTFPPRECP